VRIWSLHPQYLDAKGLVALWRESLLAQKVLQGATKGYRNHPQLNRFKALSDPVGAMARYLEIVCDEATRRDYKFDASKIASPDSDVRIVCTRGQLEFEWRHLNEKLRSRDPAKYQALQSIEKPEPHPMFEIVDGEVEDWEIRTTKRRHS
jgi:hypothetical protein